MRGQGGEGIRRRGDNEVRGQGGEGTRSSESHVGVDEAHTDIGLCICQVYNVCVVV